MKQQNKVHNNIMMKWKTQGQQSKRKTTMRVTKPQEEIH